MKLNIAYISFLISGLWLFGAVAQAQPQANYTTPYSFTTFVGANSAGYVDGVGSQARFSGPQSIAVDNAGNLFVGDAANGIIRQVTPKGEVSTYLGDPEIKYKIGETLSPLNDFGLFTLDARGNFYVFHSYSIFKITPNGTVTKIAGGNYYGNTDGTGSEARFDAVDSMVSDANGNLYVTANHAIRKVNPEGTVTTLAGKSGESGSADGLGSESRFSILGGITIDPVGNLFVVDRGNHTIRKVTPNGVVSTLAGSVTASNFGGTGDGTGADAQFYLPQGITIDTLGNLYVADIFTIRKITPQGVVTTLAGAGGITGDADGKGSSARFNHARGIAVDAVGNIYVSDTYNNNIRKVTQLGVTTTLAGLSPSQTTGSTDGTGTEARFSAQLGGAVTNRNGDIYVVDTGNHTIRKVTPSGIVTTLAGSPGIQGSTDGIGNAANFDKPWGIAIDSKENLYVTDTQSYTIRKITPSGSVTTFAGSAGLAGSHDDIGAEARFWAPTSIAVDSFDNIYVSDIVIPINSGGFYQVIRKITPAGAVTTLPTPTPLSISVNYWGLNIIVDDTNQINRFYRSSLVKVSADGTITTLAGNELTQGYQDGISTEARFSTEGIAPRHLTIDDHGNIYTAYINTIRKISRTGTVSTLAGSPDKYGLKDGVGKDARFYFPSSIAVDPSGQLYVTSGSTITKGQLAEAPLITTQPERLDVMTGGTVEFSVIVSSAPAPTYQWYINGQPFDGATNSTLSFDNANTTDAGDYSVVVTNELGSVTSNVAKLTVTAGNTPSAPSGSSSGGGGGGAPSVWFIGLLGLAALSRTIRYWRCKTSTNQS